MKHDLEAINAALKLGDTAFLPIGTVFLVQNSGKERCIKGHMGIWNGMPVYFIGLTKSGYGHPHGVEQRDIDKIISIPVDAPHFEAWERL